MSVPLGKRLRRELRVRALLIALPVLRRLPPRAALALGAALGTVAWWVVGKERRRALDNLALAFPLESARWRRRIGRHSFANLGRAALELARLGAHEQGLETLVQVSPQDDALLRRLQADRRGFVFVSCHVGNWELIPRRLAALGIEGAIVARAPRDERLARLLESSRRIAGVRLVWRGDPRLARELLGALKRGEFVALLIDQDTDVQGVFVPFFGRPAFTPRAAGDLAVRTGAPMVMGCVHRVAGGVHRLALHPVEVERTGDREQDSLRLTERATQLIESEIRSRPDEWVWMHPRWRTQPHPAGFTG